MPVFGSPFSGLANNRKLTDEELIRAIRFAAAGANETTQVYMQLAESIYNKLAVKVISRAAEFVALVDQAKLQFVRSISVCHWTLM